MKMKDIVKEDFDDFKLKNHGSELDRDDDEDAGFKQPSMFEQLGKILDSQGNPNPVTTVTTDDGQTIEVSPQQARMLRMMATSENVKPNVRTQFIKDIQHSRGLHDFVDVKDYHEMPKIFMQKYL
jgi:hypothetical protein